MKLLIFVSILLAVIGGSRAADDIAVRMNPKAPPVPAGAKVTIEFDHPQYFLGENVTAKFVIENTGAEPFTIFLGSDYSGSMRAVRFRVSATDEGGHPVLDPFPDSASMGGLGFNRTIAP